MAETAKKPIEFTDDNFEELVLKADKPVLVDFWAQWCGPCRAIAPAVAELAEELDGEAVIGKLDVDQHKKYATKFQVFSIPTLLIFKDGKIAKKQVGLTSKGNLKKMLQEA